MQNPKEPLTLQILHLQLKIVFSCQVSNGLKENRNHSRLSKHIQTIQRKINDSNFKNLLSDFLIPAGQVHHDPHDIIKHFFFHISRIVLSEIFSRNIQNVFVNIELYQESSSLHSRLLIDCLFSNFDEVFV